MNNGNKQEVEIIAAVKSFTAKGGGLELTFIIHVGDDENELNRISPALAQFAFDKAPVKMKLVSCDDEIFEKRLGAGNRRRNDNE